MISRLRYMFRETGESIRRNPTLSVASVITAAVSLLIFGLTLIIQHGFDNLLSQWEGGVEMIVYVNSGAGEEQRLVIEDALGQQQGVTFESWSYCDVACSLSDADRLFAGDPVTRSQLTELNIPTQYKVVPLDATQVDICGACVTVISNYRMCIRCSSQKSNSISFRNCRALCRRIRQACGLR